MTVSLRGPCQVTIISCYAPTAAAPTDEKETFYNTLTRLYRRASNRGSTIVAGDFNARAQAQMTPGETGIGPHAFCPHINTLPTQGEQVAEKRAFFFNSLHRTNSLARNTLFYKHPSQLATYKEPKDQEFGPPYPRPKYEALDYVCITER